MRGMTLSPLQRPLAVILALAGVTFVGQSFFPKQDLFDYARFLLLAAVLALLAAGAIRAWRAGAPLPAHAEDATPLPGWAVWLTRLAHPGWIALLLVAGLAWHAANLRVMACDEGIWYYVAHAWRHWGLLPYVGTVENKTPGIFYLFWLCDAVGGLNYALPRALGILALLCADVGVYAIGVRLHGRAAGLWAMLLFALTSLGHAMDPPITAQTESFMLVGSVCAAYAVLRAGDTRTLRAHLGRLLLAGGGLGAAIAFKQIAVLTALGLLLFYLARPRPHARTGWAVARDVVVVGAGMLLATALSVLPLLWSHVPLRAYVDGAWRILGGAGSSVGDVKVRLLRALDTANELHFQLFLLLVLTLILLLLLSTGFVALRARLTAQRATLYALLGWFVCDLIAVNATGSYYGHQMRQLLPAMALMGGVILAELFHAQMAAEPLGRLHYVLAAAAVAVLWCPTFTINYTTNDRAPALMQTAAYLRAHTTPGDYLYTVGTVDNNPILALSERRAPCRYFNQYFYHLPGAAEELKRDLAAHPPAYVVVQLNRLMGLQPTEQVPFWLEAMLLVQYDRVQMYTFTEVTPIDPAALGGYLIYRRLPESDLRKITPSGKSGSVRAIPPGR